MFDPPPALLVLQWLEGQARRIAPPPRRRRAAATWPSSLEVQEIDAVRAGATGPSTWDGYVAQVVSEAGITALHNREPVAVELLDGHLIYE